MQTSRILVTVSIALLICLDNSAQNTGTTLSLKQAVETAIANNLDVKQSGLNMDRAEINWRQARENLLPSLNGSINHYSNSGRNIDYATNSYVNQQYTSAQYNLNTNVTLFNGLRLMNQIKSNAYAYEAGKMTWQQSKERLMLQVMLAYLTVLTDIDLLEQAKKQVAISKSQVDRLTILNNEGALKPVSDLYDLKTQLAANDLTVINTQNNLDQARVSLAQLMNVPYDKDLLVERLPTDQFDMNYAATPDSIYQVAMQQLPLIKAADLNIKSFEKSVQAQKGNYFPNVGFGAGYGTNYSSTALDANNKKISYYDQLSNNYGTYIGIGISIPILNGFQVHNRVAQSKLDLKNAEYIAQTTKIQLKQNIEQDYFNMTANLNRYKTLQDQVASASESFRITEVRFNNGVINSVDYGISKNQLDQANVNLIIARYDYVLYTKILDYYQNKPLW